MHFEHKHEALNHLAMCNSEENEDLCPIVMDSCKPNCICFQPARLIDQREDFAQSKSMIVTSPRCTHADINCELRKYLMIEDK
jgi:hypothetical protein